MFGITPPKNRKAIIKFFWHKTEKEPDTTLYEDQLGWTTPLKVESGGYTDTHDVWVNLMENRHIRGIGWDLCFYYPPTETFYYIDQIAKVIYKLPVLADWNREDIFSSVDIEPQIVQEGDEVMDFNHISEVWDSFRIDGRDMRYLLEHSVLFLST